MTQYGSSLSTVYADSISPSRKISLSIQPTCPNAYKASASSTNAPS